MLAIILAIAAPAILIADEWMRGRAIDRINRESTAMRERNKETR